MFNNYIIDRLWHSYWPTKVVSLILLTLNMGLSIGSWLLYMGINLIFEVCHDLIIENPQHCLFILYFDHYVTYLIQCLELIKCASSSKHKISWNFILLVHIFSRDDDPFTHSLHIVGFFPLYNFSINFIHYFLCIEWCYFHLDG